MTPEERERLYPAVTQFMTCYFMQNFDITYGSFEGALEAFLDLEPPSLTSKLLKEVEEIEDEGLILDIAKAGSRESIFWKGLGGTRLVRRHLGVIRQRLGGEKSTS